MREATDPLRRMWDALDQADCKPHGDTHRFRSRCPAHRGTNADALQVYEGADRAAVFGCYARGCDKRAILDAIGLTWADMFPAGHRKAERRQPTPVRSLSKGAAFIDMIGLAGYRWMAPVLLEECPYCAAPHCVLRVHEAGGVDVDCSDGCIAEDVRRAVETRAAIAEKGLDLS